MEYKSTGFELTELSKDHRTGVIAHAVYDVIDRAKDISRKGMFNKSWNENKAIGFYLNHDRRQQPGLVTATFEDEKKAYTKVSFGNHTLGTDTMYMMDEGIIKDASFGFKTEKKSFLNIKGVKVRELKEVKHFETSGIIGMDPINPEAGVVMITKAELKALTAREQELFKTIVTSDTQILMELVMLSGGIDESDDLYTWINQAISDRSNWISMLRGQLRYNTEEIPVMKAYIEKAEKFIKNTNASDECIKRIESDVEEIKSIISRYDTANTQLITEPDASVKDDDKRKKLLLIKSFYDGRHKNGLATS